MDPGIFEKMDKIPGSSLLCSPTIRAGEGYGIVEYGQRRLGFGASRDSSLLYPACDLMSEESLGG